MADFIITTDRSLPLALGQSWTPVYSTSRYCLAIEATPTPHDIAHLYESPYIVVALSHTDTPRDVWRAMRSPKDGDSRHFIDAYGIPRPMNFASFATNSDGFRYWRRNMATI